MRHMIINDRIVSLVQAIDSMTTVSEEVTQHIQTLIHELRDACNDPANKERYRIYAEKSFDL